MTSNDVLKKSINGIESAPWVSTGEDQAIFYGPNDDSIRTQVLGWNPRMNHTRSIRSDVYVSGFAFRTIDNLKSGIRHLTQKVRQFLGRVFHRSASLSGDNNISIRNAIFGDGQCSLPCCQLHGNYLNNAPIASCLHFYG